MTKTTPTTTEIMPPALRPVFYQSLTKDAGAAYNVNAKGCVTLPKQKFTACFNDAGAQFSGAGSLAFHLVGYGRGGALSPVNAVQPVIKANQVSYAHGNLAEWWRVLPIGFEQGFTLTRRPAGHGELVFALAANHKASRQAAGAPDGTLAWGKLRYGGLVVTDAKGKVVPATLTYKGARILIAVNDVHAVYPVTVDPLVWLEQKVTASDGAAGDNFGTSVALAGATAVVGAPNATVNGNSDQGTAYVFSEAGGSWSQTAKLTASDGAASNFFGTSVALAGSTALVGAPYATVNGNAYVGAAYVFSESDGTWSQTGELSASNGSFFDYFGSSVALAGTTALVGAYGATVGSNPDQGAAYVFSEAGGSWSQTAELSAGDGAFFDEFGNSVAFAGSTALVGVAYATVNGNSNQGAAYVFSESDGTWSQTQKLTASDGAANDFFGHSVALVGSTALVSAADATVNGNSNQGAAYVFSESDGTWSQTQKLTASDGAAGDVFGGSVAVSGSTAVVGAYGATVGGNESQGAAYVFSESGGTWSQTQKLTASDGAVSNNFGWSVAASGSTALVGAYNAAVSGNPTQGAAYFYGQSDLGLNVSAPQTVGQGQNYVSQTIATNNASAASPAVSATVTVPAAASFVSASATQGSCSEASGVVTCDFGAINGNAGTATANVTLKATGSPGTTINNTASVALAEPTLTASAPTQIGQAGCPDGYTTYSGTLGPNATLRSPSYEAPAGMENAILLAPPGFKLYVAFQNAQGRKIYPIPGNEVHRHGPAGAYSWGVKANGSGGAYTFCLQRP
ncbi:MAG: FG-GAP repeat protein [Gammaproteobacteria bacterium]